MTIYSLILLLSQFWTSQLFHIIFCCFLTHIQVSQEASKVVWYSHLFKNFPQFVVIHTVKGFSVFSQAKLDIFFWNSLSYSMIQQILVIWSLVPLPFLNIACLSGCSQFKYCQSLSWRILSITLLAWAAAAAKSLQSCLTLCDSTDGSPPGSAVPGIFQARTLEWVAIPFSNTWKWKVKVKSLSHVQLFVTPWTIAYQVPLSMGVSRREY